MNGDIGLVENGQIPLPTREKFVTDILRAMPDTPERFIHEQYDKLRKDEVYLTREYQINVDKAPEHCFPDTTIWHLSIKRRDKAPIHDWRDLQAIKNAIAGPEFEAMELYPAATRTVDSANQFHLWVFIESDGRRAPQLPVGWASRHVDPGVNAIVTRQRELFDGGRTL